MRLIGIDYGAVRIGVAFGDTETRLASPWGVIRQRGEKTIQTLVDLMKQEEAKALVIGIPRLLRDPTKETDQARAIRAFADRLRSAHVRVIEADETFSTRLAQRQAQEVGTRGKRDDLAAAAILQGYLDAYVSS